LCIRLPEDHIGGGICDPNRTGSKETWGFQKIEKWIRVSYGLAGTRGQASGGKMKRGGLGGINTSVNTGQTIKVGNGEGKKGYIKRPAL